MLIVYSRKLYGRLAPLNRLLGTRCPGHKYLLDMDRLGTSEHGRIALDGDGLARPVRRRRMNIRILEQADSAFLALYTQSD